MDSLQELTKKIMNNSKDFVTIPREELMARDFKVSKYNHTDPYNPLDSEVKRLRNRINQLEEELRDLKNKIELDNSELITI